jgi:hypothetical protein
MKPSTPKTELPPSTQLRKAVSGGSTPVRFAHTRTMTSRILSTVLLGFASASVAIAAGAPTNRLAFDSLPHARFEFTGFAFAVVAASACTSSGRSARGRSHDAVPTLQPPWLNARDQRAACDRQWV